MDLRNIKKRKTINEEGTQSCLKFELSSMCLAFVYERVRKVRCFHFTQNSIKISKTVWLKIILMLRPYNKNCCFFLLCKWIVCDCIQTLAKANFEFFFTSGLCDHHSMWINSVWAGRPIIGCGKEC